MAEADPIQRMKAAARRASGPVTVETQRSWYFDELDRELGRDPGGQQGWKIEEPSRVRQVARFLFKMTLLAAAVFGLTATFMLWRAGAFPSLLPDGASTSIPSKPWKLDEPPPPPERGSQIKEGQDAPPNLIEPPAPPPAARAAEDADEGSADGE